MTVSRRTFSTAAANETRPLASFDTTRTAGTYKLQPQQHTTYLWLSGTSADVRQVAHRIILQQYKLKPTFPFPHHAEPWLVFCADDRVTHVRLILDVISYT